MGRLLIELLFIGVVLVVGGYLVMLARETLRGRPTGTPAITGARWVAAHHSVDGVTLVVVQRLVGERPVRVVEERAIRRIPDDAVDYDEQILEAMAVARERAAVLNSVD